MHGVCVFVLHAHWWIYSYSPILTLCTIWIFELCMRLKVICCMLVLSYLVQQIHFSLVLVYRAVTVN